jgi:hypothetical protein
MTTQIAPPVQLRAIEPAGGDEVARIVYETPAGSWIPSVLYQRALSVRW